MKLRNFHLILALAMAFQLPIEPLSFAGKEPEKDPVMIQIEKDLKRLNSDFNGRFDASPKKLALIMKYSIGKTARYSKYTIRNETVYLKPIEFLAEFAKPRTLLFLFNNLVKNNSNPEDQLYVARVLSRGMIQQRMHVKILDLISLLQDHPSDLRLVLEELVTSMIHLGDREGIQVFFKKLPISPSTREIITQAVFYKAVLVKVLFTQSESTTFRHSYEQSLRYFFTCFQSDRTPVNLIELLMSILQDHCGSESQKARVIAMLPELADLYLGGTILPEGLPDLDEIPGLDRLHQSPTPARSEVEESSTSSTPTLSTPSLPQAGSSPTDTDESDLSEYIGRFETSLRLASPDPSPRQPLAAVKRQSEEAEVTPDEINKTSSAGSNEKRRKRLRRGTSTALPSANAESPVAAASTDSDSNSISSSAIAAPAAPSAEIRPEGHRQTISGSRLAGLIASPGISNEFIMKRIQKTYQSENCNLCWLNGNEESTLLLALRYRNNGVLFNQMIESELMNLDQTCPKNGQTIRFAVFHHLVATQNTDLLNPLLGNPCFLPAEKREEFKDLVISVFANGTMSVKNFIAAVSTPLFHGQDFSKTRDQLFAKISEINNWEKMRYILTNDQIIPLNMRVSLLKNLYQSKRIDLFNYLISSPQFIPQSNLMEYQELLITIFTNGEMTAEVFKQLVETTLVEGQNFSAVRAQVMNHLTQNANYNKLAEILRNEIITPLDELAYITEKLFSEAMESGNEKMILFLFEQNFLSPYDSRVVFK